MRPTSSSAAWQRLRTAKSSNSSNERSLLRWGSWFELPTSFVAEGTCASASPFFAFAFEGRCEVLRRRCAMSAYSATSRNVESRLGKGGYNNAVRAETCRFSAHNTCPTQRDKVSTCVIAAHRNTSTRKPACLPTSSWVLVCIRSRLRRRGWPVPFAPASSSTCSFPVWRRIFFAARSRCIAPMSKTARSRSSTR